MNPSKTPRLPERRLTPTRFARLLLNLSAGVSALSIVAFVLGALALGVVSNLVFSWAYDPAAFTWGGAARALALGAALVGVAYLLYRIDSRDRPTRLVAYVDEARQMATHPGLILLLSPGNTELAQVAIHHHAAGREPRRLRHCWAVVTSQAQDAFKELRTWVEQAELDLTLQALPLTEVNIESSYGAVRAVYESLAQLNGLQPHDVVADLTGGVKTMTAGMVLACLPHGYPLEYVESDRDANGHPVPKSQRVIRVDVAFALRDRRAKDARVGPAGSAS